MCITRIETYYTRNLCVVKVTTADCLEGYGQTAHHNADITSAILHRQIAPIVLGQDSDDIDAIIDKCIESTYKFYGSHICRAASGVDTALWDLKGKRTGKSVCQLLGSERKYVEVYGSSMNKTLQPEEEAERMKMLKETKGFRAFKLHVAESCGHNMDIWPGRTEKIVPLVRKVLGDDTELYVDPNGAYSVEKAIEMGHFFEECGIEFFEEPCPFWQMEKIAEVAQSLKIPIAGGEQDFCLEQWKRILEKKAFVIAQPDITYIGGFTRALRVAKMTEEAGVQCTPHCGSSSLVTVFSIHMQAAISNPYHFMEFSIDQDYFDPWTKDLYFPKIEVRDGKVAVPQGPGWGVEINKDWLNNASYAKSEL